MTLSAAAYCIPARLSHRILANIFYYLSLRDLKSCMLVCQHWNLFFEFENNDVWRILCEETLTSSALEDEHLLSSVQTYKSKLRAFYYAWNPLDCSKNCFIKLDGFSLHRNPIAQSTDGARGKRGFKEGRHCWELWWDGPLGTVAIVGIVTKHAALQSPGYVNLLGSDDQGWGWNIIENVFLHDNVITSQYPQTKCFQKYQVGERIRVILDCDDHLLYFESGSKFLGVAFANLPPVKLYPSVCAVYGNTEVTMVYLGEPVDG